jgi:hypothetical protein
MMNQQRRCALYHQCAHLTCLLSCNQVKEDHTFFILHIKDPFYKLGKHLVLAALSETPCIVLKLHVFKVHLFFEKSNITIFEKILEKELQYLQCQISSIAFILQHGFHILFIYHPSLFYKLGQKYKNRL